MTLGVVLMNNEKNTSIDYEEEILKYVKNSPYGISTTDIAKEKKYSRNTVAKYITLLEQKKLVYIKRVGTSKLVFSVDNNKLPSIFIFSYYKMLLKGLKKKYPSDGHIMKEIGKESEDIIKYFIPQRTLNQLKKLEPQPLASTHIDLFKKIFLSYHILQPDIKISIIEEDYENQNVILRFANSLFLNGSDDLIYHIYITNGIMESVFNLILKRNIEINIEKIIVDIEKEFSYFDLKIKGS